MVSERALISGVEPTPLSQTSELLDQASLIVNQDGSAEVVFPDPEQPVAVEAIAHSDNLVFYLTDDELSKIAYDVVEGYEQDERSRSAHLGLIVRGIESLGLKDDDVPVPFDGACTVFHPLLIENAVKFQAKASGELLPASGPVKTQIVGEATEEREAQALRVKRYMNYQLVEQMPEFLPNSERCFFQTALLGDCFKKKYFDPLLNRVRDVLVPVHKLVVSYGAESIETAERVTEVVDYSENAFLKAQYSGMFRDDLSFDKYQITCDEVQEKINALMGIDAGSMEGVRVLEQHVELSLPSLEESSVPLPYIVHVEYHTRKVLSIRRNWLEGRNKYYRRCWYAHYGFVPSFGFYHFGLIHLLGNFQRTLTAILRALVDAGQFATLPAGFKAKTLRILGGDEPLRPGEWRDVESLGNDVSRAFTPLPYKEPSSTLYELLQFIEARGQKFADSTEQVIADSTNYGPVGTTMALLDASTKFFSAIYKRFYNAQKAELKAISELNYEALAFDPAGIEFNIPGESVRITKDDFSPAVDIVPVSDPNVSSNAHRMSLASTKLQAALQAPQVHNMKGIFREFYTAMGVENLDKVLAPDQPGPEPLDPVSDIQAAIQNKPIAAFPGQDHAAHIAVKKAFVEDPTLGGDQSMQSVIPAIVANIREHVGMLFAEQMQGATQGLGLGEAEAAKEILEYNKFKLENQGDAEDPERLLAKAALMKEQNERVRIQLKAQDDQLDAAAKFGRLKLDARAQEIDLAKHGMSLKGKSDLAKFEKGTDFILSSLQQAKEAKAEITKPEAETEDE